MPASSYRVAWLLAAALAAASGCARGEADGPDRFAVAGVGAGETLAVRTAPAPDAPTLATIPGGTGGLANLGCIGGLSLAEWQDASPEDRAAAAERRWCRIARGETIGWAPATALAEDTGAAERTADRLDGLAGTEWQVTRLGADTLPPGAAATLAFTADGVTGRSFCNAMGGDYAQPGGPGTLAFGPLMGTRMACAEPLSSLERRFLSALSATRSMAATARLLALFDADDRLLVTLARRRPD